MWSLILPRLLDPRACQSGICAVQLNAGVAHVLQQLVEHLKLVGRAANHFTGRMCICGGPLCDSIINFGENLSEKVLKTGFYHGNAADLMVAMGASLTVSPSCDMVAACKRKRGGGASKLVIINLQRTPYDDICDLRYGARPLRCAETESRAHQHLPQDGRRVDARHEASRRGHSALYAAAASGLLER